MDTFDHHAAHTIAQFHKMLRNLDSWLGRAVDHATLRKFDVDNLVQARLAPDQFALVRQIQAACDTAKLTAARLADKDAPSHADTETTIAELRARIEDVAGWLEGFGARDLEGAAARKVTISWMQGKSMTGANYLGEFAVPNFYFHVTVAYSILRHNGVELGKIPFLGSVTLQ